MLIIHNAGNGCIEIKISVDVLQQNLGHGDYGSCIPPACEYSLYEIILKISLDNTTN